MASKSTCFIRMLKTLALLHRPNSMVSMQNAIFWAQQTVEVRIQLWRRQCKCVPWTQTPDARCEAIQSPPPLLMYHSRIPPSDWMTHIPSPAWDGRNILLNLNFDKQQIPICWCQYLKIWDGPETEAKHGDHHKHGWGQFECFCLF